jgi:5'-3' exonuclease
MKTINFGVKKEETYFNTSAITPGTEFMNRLSNYIDNEFKNKINQYGVKEVLVSCSNESGEGEHKLFSHIRNNPNMEDNVAVYGLDADLIMLSIFHLKYCKNVYVFRETPEFMKSSIPISDNENMKAPHFLDISYLSNCIISEMNCKYKDGHRIYDYVFLCFFLGNDFMPHFPAMNIRTHGIQGLLDIYRLCIGNSSDKFLISKTSGELDWKNIGVFIKEIAKKEHQLLMNEYFVRDKFDKRRFPQTTPQEKEELLLNTPIIYRAEEKYICPEESFWEARYYKMLFHSMDPINTICKNYFEGLEWVYKYYTNECIDWSWKYNYHYPPLFSDLSKHIPQTNKSLFSKKNKKAFSPYAQLAYVLPGSNLSLLPKKMHDVLKKDYSDYYPEEYEFQWAFCRYFWESHPILPEITNETLRELDTQLSLCK